MVSIAVCILSSASIDLAVIFLVHFPNNAVRLGPVLLDTIRRRAWPKLVGLTSYHGDETEPKTTTASTTRTTSPRTKAGGRGITPRKGTAPTRVTNFGSNADVMPSTAFTGGPFDQHDTVAATAPTEDDNSSLGSEDSAKYVGCIFVNT